MPAPDQLEIIDPQGLIRFHPLDAAKGITNIGRHPDNDLVIDSEGVAPFHAILDHRSKPFQIVVLTSKETTTLDGQPAPVNTPTPLSNWAHIEFGGHQFICLQGEAEEVPEPALIPAASQPGADTLTTQLSSHPTTQPPSLPAAQPPDLASTVTVEYSTRSVAVDAGQTCTIDLTITNGGGRAAKFNIVLDGLDSAWTTLNPPQLEIPARQRATATLAITPPRLSSASAGTRTVTLSVTSPAFPQWKDQSRIAVTLNPYTEFSVSEPTPRTQTLYWSKPFASVSLNVANRGNAPAAFRVSGEDERYACRYEFKLPNDPTSQPRNAELRLAPGETGSLSVRIMPFSRRLLGLGPRRHYCTVTVAPQSGSFLPRSALAEVIERPLFGPLALALAAIILAGLIVLGFRPSISVFSASPTHIQAGQEASLTWSASPFVTLRINPDIGLVPGPDGRKIVAPTQDTTYILVAENFLSWINPDWFRATRQVSVLVDPVLPGILFTTDRDAVTEGESVTLSWQVFNADELIFTANGAPEIIPLNQHSASRTVAVTQDTMFVLQARNKFTTAEGVTASITVRVAPGTPTLSPTETVLPVIDRFDISPAQINAGQPVTLYWAVSGVDKVNIDPIPGDLPPVGNIVQTPSQTTAYTLTATNGDTPVKLVKQVVVIPVAGAPRIESFTATPPEVAPGSAESSAVQLSWNVTGETTSIEISGPGIGTLTDQPAQGTLTVSVDATSDFILTAANGDQKSQKTVQVKVTSSAPQIASVVPNTATAGSAAFSVTVNGSNFVNGSVVQWNGSPRTTTFVNATQLMANITAADIASAGTANITVFNPAGGGLSSALAFTINNPAPVISSLSPSAVAPGSAASTLTINGSGFNSQSVVRWNGTARTVTTVSATQLTVLYSAADVASAGTATISVVNPTPGGGSDAAVFTIGTQTLTVTVSTTGSGAGSVSSAPAGITCGATCSASFTTGQSVTLTAVQTSGNTITWGGSCSGTGTTCTVTMNSPITVTVNFAP